MTPLLTTLMSFLFEKTGSLVDKLPSVAFIMALTLPNFTHLQRSARKTVVKKTLLFLNSKIKMRLPTRDKRHAKAQEKL